MSTHPALPTELLLEIFRLSLVKSRSKARRASLRSYSLVCKSWHAVATPELYSGPLELVATDILGGNATLTGRLHAEVSGATSRLVHSARIQLMDVSREEYVASRELVAAITNLRELHLFRFDTRRDKDAPGFFGMIRACQATLRSLSVTGVVPGGFIDLLDHLPVLEELHFVDTEPIPLVLPPPKRRLRALTLRCQGLDATTLPYLVIPSKSTLTSLAISLDPRGTAISDRSVNLPRLEHLERLECRFPQINLWPSVQRFLSLMSWANGLPALESLVVSGGVPRGTLLTPSQYFRRLPSNVVRLDLGVRTPPSSDFVRYLKDATWIPGLRVLRTVAEGSNGRRGLEDTDKLEMEGAARKRGIEIVWIWPEDYDEDE